MRVISYTYHLYVYNNTYVYIFLLYICVIDNEMWHSKLELLKSSLNITCRTLASTTRYAEIDPIIERSLHTQDCILAKRTQLEMKSSPNILKHINPMTLLGQSPCPGAESAPSDQTSSSSSSSSILEHVSSSPPTSKNTRTLHASSSLGLSSHAISSRSSGNLQGLVQDAEKKVRGRPRSQSAY